MSCLLHYNSHNYLLPQQKEKKNQTIKSIDYISTKVIIIIMNSNKTNNLFYCYKIYNKIRFHKYNWVEENLLESRNGCRRLKNKDKIDHETFFHEVNC